MQAHRHPQEKFRRVSRARPCPICGRSDWCGYNSYLASCMRVAEGSFKSIQLSNGQIAYLHWLTQPDHAAENTQSRETNQATEQKTDLASVETRDRVYKDFLSLLGLYPQHRQVLLRRGLSESEIQVAGYKSTPQQAPWQICQRLIERGHNLKGIPGFYQKTGPRGVRYWTFDGRSGYFIPIRDQHGRIQALQRRMDDTTAGKYRLFSGHTDHGGCSCGTPAHIARPSRLQDHRIWITEGPLKADIAAGHLGAVVIGALSAQSWQPVLTAVMQLNAKEIVLAYDQDWKTNLRVYQAMATLRKELKKAGLAVNMANWDRQHKGIDDALVAGVAIRVTATRV
ncbi:DUF3854 domain-containing protein [Desulfurispora thermophila]|uniref:DUF3854 domain-containing protein n=1 Tax=Desulfurispora thermophila TaxID=265470 RepID=UPI0003642B54|nr:DUF3854 domain-containing protein [Desulfurispora thermophila]